MKVASRLCLSSLSISWALLQPPSAPAQASAPTARAVTTPREFLGFGIGDDYFLANYQQLQGYWEKLAGESDRVKVVSLGLTEEGRPQLAAIVTSPTNTALSFEL
jgi:hypothetical protein